MTSTEKHSGFFSELNRYRAIFEQGLTASLILSLAGEIIDSNEAACRIFGYDYDTLDGKQIDFLFDQNPFTEGPADYGSKKGQVNGKTSSGSTKVFSYQYSTFKTSSGQFYGILQLIDITEQAREAEYLRLLESVVKGANDAVLITSADALDKPEGPEIVYVNRAFTDMTGYSAKDVIGKTPRILQGPETAGEELSRLRKAIKNYEKVKVELLNYKKNGDEFWVELTLSPVFNGDRCTHFIALERDITTRKNREYLRKLQSEVSRIFNHHESLADSINATLNAVLNIGDFSIAEMWLVDDEKQTISLTGHRSKDSSADEFYDLSRNVQAFMKGEGLPGITWETGVIQFWRELGKSEQFVRHEEAQTAGIKTGYCAPIYFDNKIIGVLLLGTLSDHRKRRFYTPLLEQFGRDLGPEIDRKQTEVQLNRIFSFSPDIICVAGIDGYFKKVNPAMSRLLGYTQDELLSHPISSFTHPDDRLKTEAEIEVLSRNEGNDTFQNRYLTKSGKIIWLSWTTRTFFQEGKIYSIARDITEEKELKDLLEQANRLAKIGSWEVDIINNEHYWSDVTREIHEVKSDYQPNMDDGIHFYKEGNSRSRVEKALERAIQQGVSYDLEVQIITAKGNERWIRTIGKPELVNGRLVRLYGSFQDIHKRKSAEQKQIELSKELNRALKQQTKELAKSNAELEQFAFVASHDLQEPLRMVTGFLSQLEKKYADELDDKAKKYIWFATDGAKRMHQIILDLLEFSRIGKVDAEYEKVDLNELLKNVLSLNRNLISDKKAKVSVDDLPDIVASKSSIRQLFMNLISNAIKYHSEETAPFVKVTAQEDEKRWTFSVQDNGIGINREYSEKIFNIFQRLHGNDEYSGTGMGLAICKKIVEEHGGDIWVESEEGIGSTFYFTIPKHESPRFSSKREQ